MTTGLFIGGATVDIAFSIEDLPERNTKIKANDLEVSSGGSAANAAVMFAALGGTARFTTRIGRHPLGLLIRGDLEKHGVTVTDLAPERTAPPPLSTVLVTQDDGDRTLITTAYGQSALPEAEVGIQAADEADIVLLDGFHLDAAEILARHAKTRGVPVVFDSGSWKPGLEAISPLIDYAICGGGFAVPERPGFDGFADFFLGHGARLAARTHGSEPIEWAIADARGHHRIPEQRPVKDTLGAGDFFHGAFCFALARGDDDFAALDYAARIVGQRIKTFGARRWLGSLDSRPYGPM